MDPVLIFQLPETDDEDKAEIVEAIKGGLLKGALILDSRVAVLSFDENGKMNYCSPRYVVKKETMS